MLQQIQFHIHQEEERQLEIERALAPAMRENYRLSIGALERYIPSLAELARGNESAKSTLLCNKYEELNIVNYSSGQVLYGMHPKNEVASHFEYYVNHGPEFSVKPDSLPGSNGLIILGLGLGYHLESAVDSTNYQHIVVYEPNIDYFVCSLTSTNWKALLQRAKKNNVALYLQIGNDATNIAKDINELLTYTDVKTLQFYKHLHLPNFNNFEITIKTGNWEAVKSWIPERHVESVSDSYLALWAPVKEQMKLCEAHLDQSTYQRNLATLERYFPELHEEFKNYIPQNWRPIADTDGDVNLYHIETGALFAVAPRNEADASFAAFSERPNKDGLLLTYNGKKLKSYLHYQFMAECENVFKVVEEADSALPDKVKSLIMFGLGNGYSVEALTANHDVEMLFVCEPDKDLFFASLFSVDWQQVLQRFDEGNKRLYLNIGDDGTNLTNDILVQFQSVGPYVLANTYIYQGYLNEKLADAVSELREQLQVIIAMGDYFDNAKYGTAHTRWALQNNIPFLMRCAKHDIAKRLLDTPVFLVGNGPSLDGLIENIKEEREQAIVISCGTSLQTLHRHGITPDFHAEIETNRSTFDWLSRVDDRDYLKQITLLSCNGIHPDAVELFGHTLLAFKQGEAATVCLTELDKTHPFELLELAYPTVTNFAADLVSTIGFTQIYLFGTDMGFVSDTYHHSKSSGYYDAQGNELYNYAENHAMSLVIPGNFKPWVKTKYEFKVSKSVLEQRFALSSSDVYNVNDGAKIYGAQPLRPDNILLVNSTEDKKQVIELLHSHIFSSEKNGELLDKYETGYNSVSLLEELSTLAKLVDTHFNSLADIDAFVSKQRDFSVASYMRKKSLVFYYLNGTFNYINSMFSKLLNVGDSDIAVQIGNSLLAIWGDYVNDIILIMSNDQYGLDAVSSLSGTRRKQVLSNVWRETPLYLGSDLSEVKLTKMTKLATSHADSSSRRVHLNWLRQSGQIKIVPNVCNIAEHVSDDMCKDIVGITIVCPGDYLNPSNPLQANDLSRQDLALIALTSGLTDVLILQKYTQHPEMSLSFYDQMLCLGQSRHIYGGPDFIVLSDKALSGDELVLASGDRLIYMPRLKAADLRREHISQVEYVRRKEAKIAEIRKANEGEAKCQE